MDLPKLSFFFVQLAAYTSDYAEIRDAQMAALLLPLTGFGVAIDIGDPTSPEGDIHPRRKQEVGRRLALSAQKVQYKMQGVVSEGPTFEGVQYVQPTKASAVATATVSFRADTAAGLHMHGSAACKACCAESPLELQTADGTWVRTGAMTVAGATVTASAATTQKVTGIRFDWEGYPQCAL
jgi:sialate O-acetylesterase